MERKAMAQHDHQYLITQNQSPGGQDQGTQIYKHVIIFDLGMLYIILLKVLYGLLP